MKRKNPYELASPDRQHTVEELTDERDLERRTERWTGGGREQDLPTDRANDARGGKKGEREDELRVVRRCQRQADPVEIGPVQGEVDACTAHEHGRQKGSRAVPATPPRISSIVRWRLRAAVDRPSAKHLDHSLLHRIFDPGDDFVERLVERRRRLEPKDCPRLSDVWLAPLNVMLVAWIGNVVELDIGPQAHPDLLGQLDDCSRGGRRDVEVVICNASGCSIAVAMPTARSPPYVKCRTCVPDPRMCNGFCPLTIF